MSTVIVGVVSILSCVALVTYVARPAEFRVKVQWPEPPPVEAPPVAPAAFPARSLPLPLRSALPTAGSWPPAPAPPAVPEEAPAPVANRTPRPKRPANARSYLYVTKVPTRR